MSSPALEKAGVLIRRSIWVYDSAQAPVTGLVNGNFTKTLSKNGVTDATAVTVTEVSAGSNPGEYSVTFTPATAGLWSVGVTNATYNKRGWHEDFSVTTDGILAAVDTAAAVWNALMATYTAAGSFGERLRNFRRNVAANGGPDTLTLDAGASATDDIYNGCLLMIVVGTDIQSRRITDYDGTSKIATVSPDWAGGPGSGDTFMIIPDSGAPIDTVTQQAIATQVWNLVLEGSFKAENILRIVAAAVAGKVSGEPGSPIFRDLSDSKDMITGTADANGNRTAAGYGS